MINNYEIKNINGTEVLYLYIDLNSEFGSFKDSKEKLEKFIKDFIKKNKIFFAGTMVTLVAGGVFICNFDLNKNKYESLPDNRLLIKEDISNFENVDNYTNDSYFEEIDIKVMDNEKKDNTLIVSNALPKEGETQQKHITSEVQDQKNEEIVIKKQEEETKENYVQNNIFVSIKRNGQITSIELEEYIIGVVGAEMPASFEVEALKAQAVIARTYALKALHSNRVLTDNNSTQNYKSNEELKTIWGNSYNKYYDKIKSAVLETKGKYLSYKGEYIEAVYHSTSNGMTEDASNVWGNSFPYLISVNSEYDNLNPSFTIEKHISYEDLSSKLGMEIDKNTEFNILEKTQSGRIKTLKVNEKIYKGTDFRNILGLRSTDFEIIKNEEYVTFVTKGYGHGVGLSQYGANGMAKKGFNYIQIINNYYPGTTLENL